jgi:hypothetical protein
MKNRVSIIVMMVLILALPLFLSMGPIHGGDVCIHEVWAPTDCKVQVFRVKRGLKFLITASKRVKYFHLEISEELPDMNGDFNSKKFSGQSQLDVKSWTTSTQNLDPDKLYYYVLRVRDKKDCISHTVGAHWTNVRNFNFHLYKIHVYDDGDTGPKGNGECEFYFYANNKLMLKYGDYHKSWVSSGETVNVNNGGILKDIGDNNVTIKVKGRECDEASGFILDQETTWDKAEKSVGLNLKEWEKEGSSMKDFQVRAKSGVLDFKA